MKNKIKFNLELYNSGEYDVVTREGLPVKIEYMSLATLYSEEEIEMLREIQ